MTEEDEARESAAADDPAFRALLEKLSAAYAFDFREYKPASLMRRIRMRMSQVHAGSFEAYAAFIDRHPEEHVPLFNTILINVTGFFRDSEAWSVLGEEILPRVLQEAAETRSLRVWSAGCASGEETYSLALLVAEQLGDRAAEYQIKIYGTDVDEDALASARQAYYRTDQLKDVPDRLLQRYFGRDGQLWRLRRDIRRWCIFGAHNLTQAPPLPHVDLLVCRNVLIYFSSALQERILSRFHYAVRDGGFLFLGRSESLLARSRQFAPVNLKWRLFQRLPSSTRLAASVLPEPAATPLERGERADRHEPASAGLRVQRALEALPSAVMIVDASDNILSWNPAAEAMFETPVANAIGRKFRDLDVSYRVEGLRARMEDVKARQAPARLEDISFTRRSGDAVHITITIAALLDGYRFIGLLVNAEDVTAYARLREQATRIAEQHATAIEELQSTNEELETTNEELQSTNEELETTNEELQSTNEELETTVEELQAANAELATLNAELEDRGAELTRLDGYHRGVVEGIDQPLIVLDRVGVIRSWNQAAERLSGLRAEQVVGREIFALALGALLDDVRPAFERALQSRQPQQLEAALATGGPRVWVRLTPVADGAEGREVVGMVAVLSPVDGARP
ncbi:MAG TPA: CheR family methyltransferase [Terriglobales bacterium]|nr:CheR family methyltransferase [Terriglobales bacterium]